MSTPSHRPAAVPFASRRPGRELAAKRWASRHRDLVETLSRCGVQLDHDDHASAEWISGWESGTVEVIASWVARAHAAGRADEPG